MENKLKDLDFEKAKPIGKIEGGFIKQGKINSIYCNDAWYDESNYQERVLVFKFEIEDNSGIRYIDYGFKIDTSYYDYDDYLSLKELLSNHFSIAMLNECIVEEDLSSLGDCLRHFIGRNVIIIKEKNRDNIKVYFADSNFKGVDYDAIY